MSVAFISEDIVLALHDLLNVAAIHDTGNSVHDVVSLRWINLPSNRVVAISIVG